MEPTELIEKLKDFLEKHYYAEISEKARKGEKFLALSFPSLTQFNPEIADYLLDQPEECLKAAEIALSQIETQGDVKGFTVRISKLPESHRLMIRNIRSKHLNTFYFTEGIVRQKSDVRPQVTAAKFECPSCGNTLPVLQLDNKFKEPSRCSCGRKGKFRLVSKELVDAQGIVLEEIPEQLEGGEQPKRINVFLKNDLVSPLSEKRTNPGSRIIITGVIKEIPIITRSGIQSTRFDLLFEANNVESVEEDFNDLVITEEEEKAIKTLSQDPHLIKKLVNSTAPSIYGHDKIKEALLLQMIGGIRKKRDDGVITRGDIHILLVGDPGAAKCLPGETKIVLHDGSQKNIKDIIEPLLGQKNKKIVSHLNMFIPTFDSQGKATKEKILAVSKRKTKQVLSITTEQGSKIRTTPNHPFFIIKDGLILPKSAQTLTENDFVAVPKFIHCKTSLQPLPQTIQKSKAKNAVHITLPPYCTEDVARLLGYLVGDGYCAYTKTSGWATLTGNDEELLTDFSNIIKKLFSIRTKTRTPHKYKSAKEVYAISKELVLWLENISPQLLRGARKKNVPDCILKSPLPIIATFIRALFDCDGTTRTDRREISLTSANRDLVEQLRLLLKRFTIHSQIHTKYQCATNSVKKKKDFYYQLYISGDNAALFSEYLGFNLQRKQQKTKLTTPKPNTNIAVIPNIGKTLKTLRTSLGISQFVTGIPRTTYQHYERGDRNPSYPSLQRVLTTFEKTIISLYCKPPLLQQIPEHISRHYTSLKLLVESHLSWEKILKTEKQIVDEWVYDLEVENTHNFIANGFIVHNSQMLKRMTLVAPKARYVTGKGASLDYNEPLLIRKNKIIQTIPIGQFVDTHYVSDAEDFMIPLTEPVETLSLDKQTNKLDWKQIRYVYRHRTKEQLYKFTLETGRQISVTGDHSIFTLENGKVTIKPANELQKNTCVLTPKTLPNNNPAYLLSTEAARLLGYYIAEGHTVNKNGSYKIEFTVNKKEQNIIEDIKQCSLKVLATMPYAYQHGENGARIVIYGKKAYILFAFLLGNVLGKKAKEKSIPFCIINAQPEAQQAFIDAYIAGDAGVTKSRTLMSDLLYLFLQQNIIASTQQREDTKQTVIRGRTIYPKGPRYDLKSPKKEKKYSHRYTFPPFDALPKQTITSFFKEAISSKYSRATPSRAENKTLLNRLQAISTTPLFGISFRQLFGECTLEYVTEHPHFFQKQKIGRQIQISITDEGKIALKGLEQLQKLVNSDLGFVRIKNIEKVNSTSDFVYDVSVPETENFVGGFGGIICHNSGAGLSATVVKDEFLQGWSLEAGALVLANRGLCCTTGDSEFILDNGTRLTFKTLFERTNKQTINPDFKVLALNNKTLKIEPHSIKQAIKIKNDKKIFRIITRTGREINLTEDNAVLTIRNSKLSWIPITNLNKNDFIAVPKKIVIPTTDSFDQNFAYICGLIATDGHISINNRHATTSFYNTHYPLIKLFKDQMYSLGFTFNCTKQLKGRKSKIYGKECITKKDLHVVYNTRKAFAEKLIDFGIPNGNKSSVYPLNQKIAAYSEKTLCAFMKGVFDGNGSVRQNPTEIILTTGIKENAKLFQEILLRLDMISSIEHSTRSWHCSVRGTANCIKWIEKIGTNHKEKLEKLKKIHFIEVKDRIDILPNHQEFFKILIKKNVGKLGKKRFKYFWNYSRQNVTPSKNKLGELNTLLNDNYLALNIESDILWDKIKHIKETRTDFVYDFTMKGTNNFVANNIIMHNCIDEMDKMAKEDTWAMHEALEQQTVTISKANIQATLHCETTVLAAANPKFGRFDPYETIANQINLPPTLINRFDLIFPIKDLPDQAKDEKMAKFILNLHQHNTENPEVNTKLLRKYIAYARVRIIPKLTDSAIQELQEYYIKMRSSSSLQGVRSVPISARQLEGLVRLSEASAKMRLSDKVLKKDANKAIELLDYCLRQVAYDEKTGTIDIDRIATEMPASQRNKIVTLKEIIAELENKLGKTIPLEDVIKTASEKGLGESEVEEIIHKLKKAGDIFEPRQGFISRI